MISNFLDLNFCSKRTRRQCLTVQSYSYAFFQAVFKSPKYRQKWIFHPYCYTVVYTVLYHKILVQNLHKEKSSSSKTSHFLSHGANRNPKHQVDGPIVSYFPVCLLWTPHKVTHRCKFSIISLFQRKNQPKPTLSAIFCANIPAPQNPRNCCC